MGCCGKSSLTRTPGPRSGFSSAPVSGVPLVTQFRCTGSSTIVAVGLVTGRMYRFPSSGMSVQVDPRDAPGLARLRNILPVRPLTRRPQNTHGGQGPRL